MTTKERIRKQNAARRRKAKAWAVELLDAVMSISFRNADLVKATQDGSEEDRLEATWRRDVAVYAACDLYGRIG